MHRWWSSCCLTAPEHACLIVTRDGSDEAERIKSDALHVMALAYCQRA
jgi:hypothetical protein